MPTVSPRPGPALVSAHRSDRGPCLEFRCPPPVWGAGIESRERTVSTPASQFESAPRSPPTFWTTNRFGGSKIEGPPSLRSYGAASDDEKNGSYRVIAPAKLATYQKIRCPPRHPMVL